MIGHEQSPFARGAQAILKFLKEKPGYGLALPRRTLKPEYIITQHFCMVKLRKMW